MSDFDKLLEELTQLEGETETMAKALEVGDDEGADETDSKIHDAAAAGAEAGEGDEPGAVDGDGELEEEEDAGDDEGMAKSFMLQLEDGTEVEAYDGTELLKSLRTELDKTKERAARIEAKAADSLEKALGLVKKQTQMIKSLQEQVQRIGSQGRGRRAVVSVADGGGEAMKKSQEVPAGEFMAKALSAQQAGRITGLDVARMESYLNKGMAIPQDLVDKVLQ